MKSTDEHLIYEENERMSHVRFVGWLKKYFPSYYPIYMKDLANDKDFNDIQKCLLITWKMWKK